MYAIAVPGVILGARDGARSERSKAFTMAAGGLPEGVQWKSLWTAANSCGTLDLQHLVGP
jgi:hypothetical protein